MADDAQMLAEFVSGHVPLMALQGVNEPTDYQYTPSHSRAM